MRSRRQFSIEPRARAAAARAETSYLELHTLHGAPRPVVAALASSSATMFFAMDDSTFESPMDKHLRGPGGEAPPWWVTELACCLCGCLSTGPVFIVMGLLFLVRVRRIRAVRLQETQRSSAHACFLQSTAAMDPRRQGITEYDRGVTCVVPEPAAAATTLRARAGRFTAPLHLAHAPLAAPGRVLAAG